MRSLVDIVLLRRAEEQSASVTKATIFNADSGRYGRLGGRPPVLSNAILKEMQSGKRYSSADLARILQANRKCVHETLRTLHARGRVRKPEYGLYEVVQ